MAHLTNAEAAAMGIDQNYCGTIGVKELMSRQGAPTFITSKRRIKAGDEELKRRLERERQGTQELVTQLKIIGIPEPRSLLHAQGQLRFHPERRWKFDLAWPEVQLAVELQGLGSHSRVAGLMIDSEKSMTAISLGWTVMPVVYKHVKDGLAVNCIEKAYRHLANFKGLAGHGKNGGV